MFKSLIGRNLFHKNHAFALFAIMLAPFMNSFMFSIDGGEGGGQSGDEAQKALLAKIKKTVEEQVKALQAGTATQEQVNAKFAEINKTVNENFTTKEALTKVTEELQEVVKVNTEQREILKTQGAEITALKAGKVEDKGEKPVYFVDAIREGLKALGAFVDHEIYSDNQTKVSTKKLDFSRNAGAKVFKIDLPKNTIMAEKAAFDMTIPTSFETAAQIDRSLDPNIVRIPNYNNVHVASVYSSRGILTDYWEVLFQNTETDGTATKVEGDAAAQSSFKIELVSYKAHILATDYRITEQALADWNEFLSEMNRLAPNNLQNKLDLKVLGTNVTIATDIVGLRNSTYSLTIDFAGADSGLIPTGLGANNGIADVVAFAKGKSTDANYEPNAVWMNPTDVLGLEAEKNADNDSRMDRRLFFDNTGMLVSIAGLRVLRNKNMDKNQLEITSSNELQIANRTQIEMAMGYDKDGDFSKDIVTVKFRWRVLSAPRAQGGHVWVEDVAQAIADLNAAS